MNTFSRKIYLPIFVIIFFFLILSGCNPTSETTELQEPEKVMPVPASRTPFMTAIPTTLGTATPFPMIDNRLPFIVGIRPLDRSRIPVGEFLSEDEFNKRICVDVDLKYIVQKGDDLSDVNMSDRISLHIDGTEAELVSATAIATLHWIEIEGTPSYYPGLNTYCWHAEIDEGTHQATFQIYQTDGNLFSYSWFFALESND